MFNPVYAFTKEVLEATVKRGCHFFVRNWYPQAKSPLHENIKGYYIISHYDDEAKAKAHFNSLPKSAHNFLYDWNDPEHQKKLLEAASFPKGFMIYSTYFYPDYKKKLSKNIKDKINSYIYRYTNWKPERGETVNCDFYMEFGSLYATLSYAGQKKKVKFEDIENIR